MKSFNHRITEAAEKSARAETRLAASKEGLVQNMGEFLRICDGDGFPESKKPGRKDGVPTNFKPSRR